LNIFSSENGQCELFNFNKSIRYKPVIGSHYSTHFIKREFRPKTGFQYCTIKMTKMPQPNSFVFFGITLLENTDGFKDCSARCVGFSDQTYTYSYGYKWNRSNIQYGHQYAEKDIVTLKFDTNNLQLSFIHNKRNNGVAFPSVSKAAKYYPIVSLVSGTEVTVLSHENADVPSSLSNQNANSAMADSLDPKKKKKGFFNIFN